MDVSYCKDQRASAFIASYTSRRLDASLPVASLEPSIPELQLTESPSLSKMSGHPDLATYLQFHTVDALWAPQYANP